MTTQQYNTTEPVEKMQQFTSRLLQSYQNLKAMKYVQFSPEQKEDIEKNTIELLGNRISYSLFCEITEKLFIDGKTTENETFEFDFIFDFHINELIKLCQLEKRQRLIEELQLLKQRYYAISNSDTSNQFVKKLNIDANKLREEMEKNKFHTKFPDLYAELLNLLENILRAVKNTKKQIALESVSGVLSLGSAAASGALGAVNIVRAVGTAAGSTASAASAATKTAAGAASEAAVSTRVIGGVVNAVAGLQSQVLAISSAGAGSMASSAATPGFSTASTILKNLMDILRAAFRSIRGANAIRLDLDQKLKDYCAQHEFDIDDSFNFVVLSEKEAIDSFSQKMARQVFERIMKDNDNENDKGDDNQKEEKQGEDNQVEDNQNEDNHDQKTS